MNQFNQMTDSKKTIVVGTVGDFLMLNITLPGLELEEKDSEKFIHIKFSDSVDILMALLASWEITEEDKASILGTTVETFRRWNADTAMPETDEMISRCQSLFRINMALMMLYPKTLNARCSGVYWLNVVNDEFDGKTAVEYMAEFGPEVVERYLLDIMYA